VSIPLAASVEIAGLLTDLAIVLVAAKLGDELFKRIRQPAVVGEILAGLIVGPSVFGLVDTSEVLEVFAELGVVFLLFWVGLETRLSDLRTVGRTAVAVGLVGLIVPFGGGFGLGLALGENVGTSMFLAAALVATSVGITSAVLSELGLLKTRAARTILGAAIVDDVLALMLLAIAGGIATTGGIDLAELALVLGLSVAFVAFFGLGGTALLRRQPRLMMTPRFAESPLLPAVILCLVLAAIAAQIGLAAIIGAFLAGMMVAETKEQHPIEKEIAPLYAFFPPFFFVFIGLSLDLGALADPETIALLIGVTVLAVATKFVGAWLAARPLGRNDAIIVGVGMVPRGEVGIIVAGIGNAEGVLSNQLFAVIVGMSVLTTILAPPILRWRARDMTRTDAHTPGL
jgi:Kef-type K+ transport system membrane component KefB